MSFILQLFGPEQIFDIEQNNAVGSFYQEQHT